MYNTKKDLINYIAEKKGITKRLAKEYVEDTIECIKDILLNSESLHIHGFINFDVVEIPEKTRMNGLTGENIVVPQHKIIKAKLAKEVKNCLR